MADLRSRFMQGVAVGILASGVITAIVVTAMIPLNRARREHEALACSIAMRGVIQSLVTSAGQNAGKYPDASSDWSGTLVQAGLATAEMFESSARGQRGIPLFLYLPPPNHQGRFTPVELLLVQNPATTDGRGGLIGYNDNHVEFLVEPEFSRMVQTLIQGGPRPPY